MDGRYGRRNAHGKACAARTARVESNPGSWDGDGSRLCTASGCDAAATRSGAYAAPRSWRDGWASRRRQRSSAATAEWLQTRWARATTAERRLRPTQRRPRPHAVWRQSAAKRLGRHEAELLGENVMADTDELARLLVGNGHNSHEQATIDEIERAKWAQRLYGGLAYGSAALAGIAGLRPNRPGEIRGPSDRMLHSAPGLLAAYPLARASVGAGNRKTGLEAELEAYATRDRK